MPRPKRRRYSKYSFEDTQRALEQQARQLGILIVPNTSSATGRRVGLKSDKLDELIAEQRLYAFYPAVILAKSSHWYRYNLNAYQSGIVCAVVGTHDSCVEVPVIAMDDLECYEPEHIRTEFEKLLSPGKGLNNPSAPMDITANPDKFEDKYRKTRYGHAILVGALIRGRKDARERLLTLPERTRLRTEAEVRHLRARRPGRPLKLWEKDEDEGEDEDEEEEEEEGEMPSP